VRKPQIKPNKDTMKKGLFLLPFILLNLNIVFAQTDVNIDSLYTVYSTDVRYDYLFKDKNNSSAHKGDSGYIVDSKGDTVFGQLFLNIDGIHVDIKNEKIKKRYRADKYKILKYGDRTFVSRKFDMFPVSAEILESGKTVLYVVETEYTSSFPNKSGTSMTTKQSISTLTYYLEKDGVVYGPFSSDFKDFIYGSSLVSECVKDYTDLYERVQQKKFKYSDLRTIVRIYNVWYVKNFPNSVSHSTSRTK
jgi:hypothetical protein